MWTVILADLFDRGRNASLPIKLTDGINPTGDKALLYGGGIFLLEA